MSEHLSHQSIPPLTIEYRDGSVFIPEGEPTKEQGEKLFQTCMLALSLGATVKNPYPNHIGGVERVEMLRQEAIMQGISMLHLKSDGEYGIIR